MNRRGAAERWRLTPRPPRSNLRFLTPGMFPRPVRVEGPRPAARHNCSGFATLQPRHISDRLDYLGKQAARRPVNQG